MRREGGLPVDVEQLQRLLQVPARHLRNGNPRDHTTERGPDRIAQKPKGLGLGGRKRKRKRKPNLEELGGSVGGLAGGDLEEGGDQGLLLRGRRGIAGHGSVVASTGFSPPSPAVCW